MRELDQDILSSQVPGPIKEVLDHLLSVHEPKEEDQVEANEIFSQEELKTFQMVDEALTASRGTRKLLDATYGKDAQVTVSEDEPYLLDAIERIFGVRHHFITFNMYKRALSVLEEQSIALQEMVVGASNE